MVVRWMWKQSPAESLQSALAAVSGMNFYFVLIWFFPTGNFGSCAISPLAGFRFSKN